MTYADSVGEDGESLQDVFMAELRPGERPVTIRAEQGGQQIDPETGNRYLVLKNGHRYQGLAGHSDYQIVSFAGLRQRLEDGPRNRRFGIEAQPTQALIDRGDPEAMAELHFRLALPLVVLLGSLLAIGVGQTKPRQGRFARVLPGIGVFVLYYAALVFNRDALSDGKLPMYLGMWLVHLAFGISGVVVLYRSAQPAKV